ncbi:LPXTG-motif cell wall anchor domain-containing protein [Sarcina sp. DSM 11001]|uniref:SpaA isopeptide-forming pilin-related protein n=1 Tax=Sarcina sp. DSM 11001 TaxID=1798184 RepID=UPI00088CA784|nr:SpaA isopeptide-forming pilin-related protein [Sarcina sp. DSM 11001]SDL31159.1 LPXTG-motif cell wall anchor domain-containing protein [Sarcina sp. DSM 11001]
MVVAMALPAMAAGEATTDGSITINSPIVGAKYNAYKVFDMTMNEAGDSFSYTIAKSSPFYNAVKAYADVEANGLKLTATSADPNTFNVSATDAFNAQTFGKALEAKLTGDNPEITGATAIAPEYEEGKNEVTVAKATAISFEDLALGYYLILSEYPDPYGYVSMEFGTEGQEGYQKWTFTKESTADDISTAADVYAAKTYPDLASAQAYVAAHADDFEKAWADMTESEQNKVWTDLKNTTKQSAINLINEKIAGALSDDNAVPITSRLVFVDTTTPDAVINEKNETNKWDVPVNPEGHADMPDVPDHGEPKGGKNIIVKEAGDTSPAIYADWSEANVGDSIHYQLSINAVNFEQTVTNDPSSVKQVKEYILSDYENENMHFDTTKGLNVTIVKKNADGTGTTTIEGPTDYSAWKDKFFKNDEKEAFTGPNVLTTESDGLAISWVEEITEAQAEGRANVTTTVVDKLDGDGNVVYQRAADQGKAANEQAATQEVIDAGDATEDDLPYIFEDGFYYLKSTEGGKIPETETHYFASKYPNDVTILVDYYMILDDTAVIDGDGNKNYAQYGVGYVSPEDRSYTPVNPLQPDDDRTPDSVKDKDDATVYTYALALHKVDQDKKDLAGAKFHIMGLTVTEKAAGYYKVSKYDPDATAYGTEMETDSKGLLVIEGLSTSAELTIEETAAPDGYNKLEGTITGSAEKLSETVTTTFTETYYDADGNVVDQKENAETTTTVITTIDNLKAIAIEIVNQQGTELPSTGGIGTTIFYVVGAILVIGAGVVLITRRRMDA